MMKETQSLFEWIVFSVFVILEIVIFILRVDNSNITATQLDNVLYDTFTVLFSLYIGYFLQRIDSAKKFQESLKKYGLSAYRRISDIKKSVYRIREEINRIRPMYPKDKIHELDILRIGIDEMDTTVNSSISDWIDIIGEEIHKKERIEELQKEQQVLTAQQDSSSETNEKLQEVRNEINRLREQLPLSLRGIAQNDVNTRGRMMALVDSHFDIAVEAGSSVILKIHTPDNRTDSILRDHQPYYLRTEDRYYFLGRTIVSHINIVDKNNQLVGEVINPFRHDGVQDEVFFGALLNRIWYSYNITHQTANGDNPQMDTNSPLDISSLEAQYLLISPNYSYEFYIRIPVNPLTAFRG